MSVFKKWSKGNKINNGEPYSLEELMDMGEAELGALYRGYGEISVKKENAITDFKGFSVCGGMALFGFVLPFGCIFGFPHVSSSDPAILLLALQVLVVIGVIFGFMVGFMAGGLLYTAYGKAKNLMVFDDVKKSDMELKDIKSLVDDSTQNDDHSAVSGFLCKAKKALWMGEEESTDEPCHWSDYPDEDLGRLVKILLPVMKLDHDGGSLNDESFKILDDELHLSERIDSFNEEVSHIRDKIKEEEIRKEKEKEAEENHEKYEKKRKAIEDSVSIAHSMLNRLNVDRDRNKALEEHSEFMRIKDMRNRLGEQKTRLDVSLASPSGND